MSAWSGRCGRDRAGRRRVAVAVVAGLVAAGCSAVPGGGAGWSPRAPVVVLEGVELADGARGGPYPEVCAEAAEEIAVQLRQRLPEAVRPVKVVAAVPGAGSWTRLRVTIESCDIDVDQWGGNFDYYLDLDLSVSLEEDGRTVRRTRFRAGEQEQAHVPVPLWLFTFEGPVRRILGLFRGLAQPGAGGPGT